MKIKDKSPMSTNICIHCAKGGDHMNSEVDIMLKHGPKNNFKLVGLTLKKKLLTVAQILTSFPYPKQGNHTLIKDTGSKLYPDHG